LKKVSGSIAIIRNQSLLLVAKHDPVSGVGKKDGAALAIMTDVLVSCRVLTMPAVDTVILV